MRYLTLTEALTLHTALISTSGGSPGVRDLKLLESSLAQPRMTFGEDELYPGIAEKASALAFSVINNHPFVDGNKRIAHALMETFLVLNGFEIDATVEEQEKVFLKLASGTIRRKEFRDWARDRLVPFSSEPAE
jgi:death on curing protein